jgi:hypothetical protein
MIPPAPLDIGATSSRSAERSASSSPLPAYRFTTPAKEELAVTSGFSEAL